jgi:predicted GNAT family acetyltransferase
MHVRRFSDAAEFLAEAGPLLLADEARHNLILGLAGTIRDRPGYYGEFHLWTVERAGDVVAAALQTPPYNLVLGQAADEEALEELAGAISSDGIELPGVIAAIPEADRFADAWELLTGTTRRLRRAQRIYRLGEVRPVAGVSGRPRIAGAGDLRLLVDWNEAFARDIVTDVPMPAQDIQRAVETRLHGESSGFMLWEDDEPVSMAGWGAPTATGIRIGPVYTPPDRRGRGYASAVTAALSADQLASGRRFCFLYTDLSNPTANKIYVDIGYEPVCDAVDYVFERARSGS